MQKISANLKDNFSTVVILGPNPSSLGGVSTCVRNSLKSEIKNFFNIFFIRTGTGKGNALRANLFTVLYHNFLQLLIYVRLIYFNKIDLVHIHTSSKAGFWRFGLFILLSKVSRQKLILHIHGAEFKSFFYDSGILKRKLIQILLEACTHLIVLSKAWESFFNSITSSIGITIVPNSVHIPNILDDSRVLKKNSNVKITFLGGLVRRKGILEFMKVSRKLIIEEHNIDFFIGGFPSLDEFDIVDSLEIMSLESKLKDRFTFKMNISDSEKDELYRTSDIFVLQSENEGLPFALLEAMSYSIPVITTPVGGIPEVISNLENGFIIPPGDEKELYDKIKILVSDYNLRLIMGKKNRKKVKDNYSLHIHVDKVREVYNKVLN